MLKERYITDNPFRILSVVSTTPLPDLRRKADSVVRESAAGLLPEVPLQELFGSVEFSDLGSLVRSIDRNAKEKTMHRTMWPTSQRAVDALLASEYDPSALSELESVQVSCLRHWYAFLTSPSVESIKLFMSSWHSLRSQAEMRDLMTQPIMEEDEVDEKDARDIIRDAQMELGRHLLERICQHIALEFEDGNQQVAEKLLRAFLLGAGTDISKEAALKPIVDVGFRLQEKVRTLVAEIPEWNEGQPTDCPAEVMLLRSLSKSVASKCPGANSWLADCCRWDTVLASSIREQSLRKNHEGDNVAALAIAMQALSVASEIEQVDRIRADIEILKKIVRDEDLAKIYKDILPIGSPPTMQTLNGVGTRLYGRTPFPGDQTKYFANLYFTFLYVPIFPIKRYLVSPASPSGWYFHGQTKWTKWMKAHLWASFATIVVFGVVAFIAPPSASYSNAVSSQTRRERDLEDLKAIIDSEDVDLLSSSAKIDAEEEALAKVETSLKKRAANAKSRADLIAIKKDLDGYQARAKALDGEINRHNATVKQNKSHIAEYNRRVDDYNASAY